MLLFYRFYFFNPNLLLKKQPKKVENFFIIGNIIYNLVYHLRKEFSEKITINTIEFALVDLLEENSYFDFEIIYENPEAAKKLFSKKVREYFLKELLNLSFIEELDVDENAKFSLANKFKVNKEKIEQSFKEIIDNYNSFRFSKSKAFDLYLYIKENVKKILSGEKEFLMKIKEKETCEKYTLKSYLAFSLFYNLNYPKKVLLDFFIKQIGEENIETDKDVEEFINVVNAFSILIENKIKEKKDAISKKREKESLDFLLNLPLKE